MLDNWLWTYRDDSFLPHGTTGERFAERQPILLGNEPGNPNAAQALFAIDTDPGDLEGYERCIVIFDGRLEPALADARSLWSRCKKAGHAITYWRQGEICAAGRNGQGAMDPDGHPGDIPMTSPISAGVMSSR